MITPPDKQYILYIEDDPEDVELLDHVLQEKNLPIRIVQMLNGADALDFLEKAKVMNLLPEMILLDINMPKLDGKETFVCIKADKRLARIPLAVLSTSNLDMDTSYFKKYHIPYIIKPGDTKKFGQEIMELIKRVIR